MRLIIIGILIGYFIGCWLPLGVTTDPNQLPVEQKQKLIY